MNPLTTTMLGYYRPEYNSFTLSTLMNSYMTALYCCGNSILRDTLLVLQWAGEFVPFFYFCSFFFLINFFYLLIGIFVCFFFFLFFCFFGFLFSVFFFFFFFCDVILTFRFYL